MVGAGKKIFLVNPSCSDPRINPEDAMAVPIGLYYIGAVLMENGFTVHMLNLAQEHDPAAYLSWMLEKEQPGIIGFSVLAANRTQAFESARLARKRLPRSAIVFGGPFATFMPEYVLNANAGVDYVIKKEGEAAFLDLANILNSGARGDLETVSGLVYKKGGEIVHTPDRAFIPDLDTLPHPSAYFSYQHLAMSRGCPGRCTFCGSPGFWGKGPIRFHSPQWFADEIQALYGRGVRHFYISDDTFTLDRERVIAFCRILVAMNLDITWNAISRVDRIDETILFWMRRANCIQISFGVESGSKTIRKHLGKPVNEQDIITAFRLCTAYGIMPRAYFIYGSPGETDRTITQSGDLIQKIKPLSAVFYLLVIFPGTFLYDAAREKGLFKEDIWDQPLEDIPWFELDPDMDLERVKAFGDRLRRTFFDNIHQFAADIRLTDDPRLFPFHADFLSRLALTFSHGEYALDPRIAEKEKTAENLYKSALSYHPAPRAFLGLGMLYLKRQQFDAAVAVLGKGLALYPDHEDMNLCMALNHMNLGDFRTARDFLESVGHLPGARKYMDICNQKLYGKSP